jgi:hypothetical protein
MTRGRSKLNNSNVVIIPHSISYNNHFTNIRKMRKRFEFHTVFSFERLKLGVAHK